MEYKRKRLIRAALQKAETKRKQLARQAESAADIEQQTPEEYAQTVVSEKTAQAAENLQSKALDTGRISYRQFRILQEKHLRVPTTHAAQPAETENVPLAQSADRRETGKRQSFRQRALDKREIKTPDSYRDKMQALKRQHLTRETVRRHLQKQAGGTVLGSGVRLPDTVPVFSGGSIRQAALGRVRTLLQAAWLRLKVVLTRTIRRAAGSLLALLGAGGVVLLLAMVIGAAAAVIGSPMGILFADESGDPNSIHLAEIVAETNAAFGTAINDIVSAHPECSETTMEYNYEDGHTWASYWPEVLAVFAVQNNLNNDGDVVVIDESKKRWIQDTFWAMHEIRAEVEEVTPHRNRPRTNPTRSQSRSTFCTSRSAANRWTRWQICTTLRKTSGTFCTSCYPRKCAPVCLLCAVGPPLLMASCAGRCRDTLIYPATSGKWTLSAVPGIAAQTFPHRRVRLSSLPTAVRYWSVAGTTATAIRFCWITVPACPRGTPT